MVWQEGLVIYSLCRNSGVVIILHEFFVFYLQNKARQQLTPETSQA